MVQLRYYNVTINKSAYAKKLYFIKVGKCESKRFNCTQRIYREFH